MTPSQARGAGRAFGWFIAVSLSIALIGGLIIGELTSFSLIVAILAVGLAWTVMTLPLVWLLARFDPKKKKSTDGEL
jgi:hypothetical protein